MSDNFGMNEKDNYHHKEPLPALDRVVYYTGSNKRRNRISRTWAKQLYKGSYLSEWEDTENAFVSLVIYINLIIIHTISRRVSGYDHFARYSLSVLAIGLNFF